MLLELLALKDWTHRMSETSVAVTLHNVTSQKRDDLNNNNNSESI